jgi:glycosyltransferase involved in cell wall biosynthesis
MDIVNLHILYRNYYTGIDRYLDMYRKGIVAKPKYDYISIHSVYLTDDLKILFSKIDVNEKGEISAVIPLPQNAKLLLADVFWKNKYVKVVTEILTLYMKKIKNPIFAYHNLFLSEIAIEFKNCFGGKIVTHLHCLPWKFDSENNTEKFNKLYQLYSEKKYEDFKKLEASNVDYSASDRIICISESAIDYLTNIHHIDRNKIRLVRNGLKIQNAVKETQRQSMPPKILYAGKVSKNKGVYEMLEALKLVKRRGYDFKLKLAGTVLNHDTNRIKTKYREMDVEILGEIPFEELQQHYVACTIGIVPSLHEQFCYVALEMAAFGIPVAVSQVDGLAEIFAHEKTAMLVPMVFDPDFGLNADTEKFADHIIRLITDGDLRETLSRNVRKLYEEEYTSEKMINNTIKIYNELCLKSQY